MVTTPLLDADIDLELLRPLKIAILGYGAQGRSHALNLRDGGFDVIIGHRPSGRHFDAAVQDGFRPLSLENASRQADLINLLLPDELHGAIFQNHVRDQLAPGKIVMTCHGYSLHYRYVVPPEGIAAVLVAPKAAGHRVRSAFVEGTGVPFLVAPGPGADQRTCDLGFAYAAAQGGGRVGVYATTVAAETETDLFGEQAVLCGGVSHLIKAAFDTLVEAGYQEELAFFECVHELKLVVDLIHRGGLSFMHDHISNTAEFGDYTRGPRIIDQRTRDVLREILNEIRSTAFAQEMQAEWDSGQPVLTENRRAERQSRIEQVGRRLRAQMKLS